MAHQSHQYSSRYTPNGHAVQPAPQALPQVVGAWDGSSRQQTATKAELAARSRDVESPTEEYPSASRGPPQKNFVSRLYNLVNDLTNYEVIRWADDGNGFIILNQEKFSKEIIGTVFKHNNMASFIRQLNMYDFHKRNRAGRKNGKNDTCFFQHQDGLFRRGQPDFLHNIKRKGPDTGGAPYPGSGNGRAMPPSINGSDPYNVNAPAGPSQKDFNELKDKYDDVSSQLKNIQDTLQQFIASQAMQRQPLQPPLQTTMAYSQRPSTDSLDSYAYDGSSSNAFYNKSRAFSATSNEAGTMQSPSSLNGPNGVPYSLGPVSQFDVASSASSFSARHQSQPVERTGFHPNAQNAEIESSLSRAQSYNGLPASNSRDQGSYRPSHSFTPFSNHSYVDGMFTTQPTINTTPSPSQTQDMGFGGSQLSGSPQSPVVSRLDGSMNGNRSTSQGPTLGARNWSVSTVAPPPRP